MQTPKRRKQRRPATTTRETQLVGEMQLAGDEGPVIARVGDFTTEFPIGAVGPADTFARTASRVYFLDGDGFGEWHSSVPRNPPPGT